MGYINLSILEAVAAGVISIVVFEFLKWLIEWVILRHRPIQYVFTGPPQIEFTNTEKDFQLRFYLRNRTNVSLPVRIFPSSNGVDYPPKPIQWEGRREKYDLQDITLSPGEWGNFLLNGLIKSYEDLTVSLNLAVTVPKKRKPIEIGMGSSLLKLK